MRNVRLILTALIVALCFAPVTRAQEAVWTEPGGRFSLAFRDLGWTALPAEIAAQSDAMLVIARNDSQRDGRARICTVSRRAPHLFGGGQGGANELTDRSTAADYERNFGQPVSNFAHGRAGPVATVAYEVTLGGNQMHSREFALATTDQVALYNISCGAPAPLTQEEAASTEAVLATLAMLSPPPPAAIVTGGWEMRSPSPGAPPCRAVKLGRDVDTQLLRSREGRLVLIAGRGDWDHSGPGVQVSLSINGAAPDSVTAYPVGPLLMVLTTDEQVTRLRTAQSIEWRLPWGAFTAEITGLGAAFDAIGVCPG